MVRHRGLVRKVWLSALGLTVALAVPTAADARRHVAHHHRVALAKRHHGAPVDSPAFAAMVVESGSGRVLYAKSENELRHPASITKVMTLYLLFEKLDDGTLRLDSRIPVSAHAASMAPTKLGLRPGSTIAVEDAIKAIVTKSANDMAVAVAEAVGGDENSFAALMTRRAHAIGMSRTTYVNASGLPDDRQITTARDLTLLGRSIHDRFPRYYHYFSIPSFTYAGSTMPNHNHLMERVDGMDGIKTGYTRASGFNLLSSVNRGGRRIVSVVLGGRSAASRDRIMASLIEEHIEGAAPTRVADVAPPSPVEEAAPTPADDDNDEVRDTGSIATVDTGRGSSLIAPTLAVPPAPVRRTGDRAPTPGQVASAERPRPAFIAGAPKPDLARAGGPDRRRAAQDGSTNDRPARPATGSLATATPSTLRGPAARPPVQVASLSAPVPVARPEPASLRPKDEESRVAQRRDRDGDASPKGGWVIQIGATDAADKATDLLNRARSQGSSALASARPFTEKVRSGGATLYRARFAGLEADGAEQACRTLKRSGFACFATKD